MILHFCVSFISYGLNFLPSFVLVEPFRLCAVLWLIIYERTWFQLLVVLFMEGKWRVVGVYEIETGSDA